MTVYEWLISKDNIIVSFDKSINDNYMEILKIQMDIDCECSTIINHTFAFSDLSINTARTFCGNQIPDNDATMLNILNQMHKDLIADADKYFHENN